MVKKKKLVIYGLGETADIAYEYFTHDSIYDVVAFTVDKEHLINEIHYAIPVIDFKLIDKIFPPHEVEMFVAASYNKLNRVRAKMYYAAKAKSYVCANYISSRAFVWHNVKLGDNLMIFENVVVQHSAEIGNNIIMWTGSIVAHQTKIEDHVFLATNVVISGFCLIGEFSFLGANCTLIDNIKLGKNNLVGSGALIIKNSQKDELLIGVPAQSAVKKSYQAFNMNHDYVTFL